MRVGSYLDMAAVFRNGTAHVLELNGGVEHMEAIAEHLVDLLENRITLRRGHIFDQRVAAQCMRRRTQAPDVNIMHIDHTCYSAQRLRHGIEIESPR